MTKDFYIFRHGQSTYNAEGRTQGRTNDSVLTEKGKLQATEAGKILQNRGIELIVASPLKRTLQTADLVAAEIGGVPVTTDERFIEVDVGEIEEKHKKDIWEKFGEKYALWCAPGEANLDLSFKGGETRRQVRKRVFEGLDDYVRHNPHQIIGIASHGVMMRQIVQAINRDSYSIDNCTIMHLRYEDGAYVLVECLNTRDEK